MQGKALFQVRQRLAAIYGSFELCEIVMKWLISDLASVFTHCVLFRDSLRFTQLRPRWLT